VRVRADGAWRTVRSGRIRINNAWRQLTRAFVFQNGAWRQSAVFVEPLTLSVSPATANGGIIVPGTVTTGSVTATPTGGLAPFTYAWARISGDPAAANAPTNATTSFSLFLNDPVNAEAVFRCTVTDALGSTAAADVTASFQGFSFDPFF
jgi:hypothetical protein